MKQKKIIEIYEQEKTRIKNSTNYFSQKTGIEADELESEANLAFCKSFKSYDKRKASFRTHLHNNINYALLNFANQNRKPYNSLDNEFDLPAKEEIQFCIEDNFSPLAAEAARIIIDQELTHLSQLTQILLKGYKNSTYKNYPSQIQSIYQEIRETINANKRRNGHASKAKR